MAADENINAFSEENLENLRESVDYTRQMVENAKALIKLTKEGSKGIYNDVNSASTQMLRVLDKVSINYARFQKFEVKSKEVKSIIKNIEDKRLTLNNRLENILKVQYKAEEENLKVKKEALETAQELRSVTSRASDDYEKNKEGFLLAKEEYQLSLEKKRALSSSIDLTRDALDLSTQQLQKLKEYEKVADDVSTRLAQIKGILTFTSKIPILGRFVDVEAGMKRIEDLDVLKHGFWSSLGKSIGAAFSALSKATLVLGVVSVLWKTIDFIKDSMFGADKQITDIANKMGTTKKEAQGVRDYMIAIAQRSDRTVLLQKEVAETWFSINNSLGTAVKLNAEFLQDMTLIQHRIGLSDEGMKGLTIATQAGDKVAADLVGRIASTNNLQKLQGKTLLDNKTLIEKTFKITGYLRTAFQGNTTELAKGVAQAHAMGTELGKINSIADSFLDFESSISAELESQLLTGRNINLDQARYFAMTNNMPGLMNEIQKNFPSWKEFNSQNRIAAEAQAQALGMSKDEMSDMIFEQETLNKLKDSGITRLLKGADLERFKSFQTSKEAYAFLEKRNLNQKEYLTLLDGEAYKRLQSVSAEEKFNKAIDKLKEAFSNFFTGERIDQLSDMLTGLANAASKGPMGLMGIGNEIEAVKIAREIQDITKDQAKLVQFNQLMEEKMASKGIYTKLHPEISKSQINEIRRSLIEEYGGEFINKLHNKKQEDFISRNGQITSFRKDDIIMGGTNLTGNNSDQLKELKDLNNNIKVLINSVKNGKMEIDGYEIGKYIALGTYNTQ